MAEKNLNPFVFKNFTEYGDVMHFISTRVGGFSDAPYNSLNLGFNIGDDNAKVLKNRKLLASTLGLSLNSFVVPEQVHKGNVAVIKIEEKGRGAVSYEDGINATDAMVTDVPNVCLMVLTADCVPILFFDPVKKVIGVAHAGWKGTVGMIAQNTVRLLQERFNSAPKDIIIGIGPSIGPCCYEVGGDVIAKAGNKNIAHRNNKDYFDLWEANKQQLIQLGILEGNIEVSGICICCNSDMFFSARRDNGKTGRFGSGIMIK